MSDETFDLSKTYVHFGRSGDAVELPGFTWTAEYLRDYLTTTRPDGAAGRLVGVIHLDRTWKHWERHVGGDELVVQLTGASDLIQMVDGEERRFPLTPGVGFVNRRGIWHTSDVHEAGLSLFVAAGGLTTYRPRTAPTSA